MRCHANGAVSLGARNWGDGPPLVVVMGVSGSGKTTIGAAIAQALGIDFVDGDSLHSDSNIAKMEAGKPLTDDDRWPWLAKIGQTMTEASSTGLVIACSALKRSYRDAIRHQVPTAVFLYLSGSREVLLSRLEGRKNHFMPMTLLDSQLATLETLQPDENGFGVEIDSPLDEIVADIVARFD